MGLLAGKTGFVTGGAGGIGAAICARFAKEGAEVVAADVAEPAAESTSTARRSILAPHPRGQITSTNGHCSKCLLSRSS